VGGSLAGRLAAVALGIVLLVAGIAKRADRGWPQDATALGTPAWAIPGLPWFEILLGAVLVSGLARPVAAALAGLVLLAFTGLLVLNLARGRRPPCACFGATSRRPIGPWSVVRNLVLLALAAIAFVA
jgi:uncharacterized membrane protein YphA (DoxX/SURF4 family)